MYSAVRSAGVAAVTAVVPGHRLRRPARSRSRPGSRCLAGSSGNRTTSVIGAHSSGHHVDHVVNDTGRFSRCPWRVVDVHPQAVVRSPATPVSTTA